MSSFRRVRSGAFASIIAWAIDGVLKGRPVRDALRLAGRLIGARLMSFVTLLVAAFFVRIETFAEFGVYQTAATLLWTACFLRYDAAILAAPTLAGAQATLRLSTGVSGTLWLVSTAASLAAGLAGLVPIGLAILFPYSVLARILYRLTFLVATRDGDFHAIGRASLVQAFFQPVSLLVFVLTIENGAVAFAASDIIGHFAYALYLAWCKKGAWAALRHGWSVAELTATARQWVGMPLYNLPGSFLSLAFVTSPLLIMPLTATPVMAGHVALAFRIFDVPTQIITAASTPIFLHRMRPDESQEIRVFGRKMLLALGIALTVLYGAMAGSFAQADPWLHGTPLGGLSGIVSLVAAFQLFVALAAPLNDSCALYPEQKKLALVHGISVLGSAASCLLALWFSPRLALVALAVISFSRAIALGEMLRKFSLHSRRERARMAVEVGAP
jgi:O-antigen/teichoic acid export membrane protein